MQDIHVEYNKLQTYNTNTKQLWKMMHAWFYESHFIDRTVYIQPIANKMYKTNKSGEMHRLQMCLSLSLPLSLCVPLIFSHTVMTEWNCVVALSSCQSETVLYRNMTS